jgi:hypothetical protein
MAREWYVVVGLAKTGTTIVATTILRTLKIGAFCMEPDDPSDVARFAHNDRLVIKILYDFWYRRPADLNELCRSIAPVIAMVRDPRDEMVSRLHYLAHAFFLSRPTSDDDRSAWLDVFQRKEAGASTGLLDMWEQLDQRFGIGSLWSPGPLHTEYATFVAATPQLHVLRYEDFLSRQISDPELQRILAGARDVGLDLRHVLRTGAKDNWQGFFTDRDMAYFNKELGPFLARFGYSLERHGGSAPSPAGGSAYVARLIDDARARFTVGRGFKSA